jgi:hypothetical protein
MKPKAQTEEPKKRISVIPNTPAQQAKYEFTMARWMEERGYPELAINHLFLGRVALSEVL